MHEYTNTHIHMHTHTISVSAVSFNMLVCSVPLSTCGPTHFDSEVVSLLLIHTHIYFPYSHKHTHTHTRRHNHTEANGKSFLAGGRWVLLHQMGCDMLGGFGFPIR